MMGGYGYGYGPMMGGGWFGAIIMFALWALFIAGVVLLIVWLVRSAGGQRQAPLAGGAPGQPPAVDEALAIARKRLAASEITPEQFEEIRKTLSGS